MVTIQRTCPEGKCAASLSADRQLFLKARQFLKSDHDKYLSVSFPGDNREYFPVWEPEYMLQGIIQLKRLAVYVNYDGGSLLPFREELDFTLLSSYDGFFFQTLEEYTWAIAELILSIWPGKPVFFGDQFACKILDGVCIAETKAAMPAFGNILSITSDRTFGRRSKTDGDRYDSIQVMISLCWARVKRSFGDRNRGKTILIIDQKGRLTGLGDYVKAVQAYSAVARERGWIPVANVYGTQYSDSKDQNIWEALFEPVSEISLSEALQSAEVIRGRDNGMDRIWAGLTDVNPYCEQYFGRPAPLHLRRELLKQFQMMRPEQLGDTTLGFIGRGTDYTQCFPHNWSWDAVAQRIDEYRKQQGYQSVFLATEDADCLEAFQKQLGDRLLYVEQKRVRGYHNLPDAPYISELLAMQTGKRIQWAETYLYITWCLSRCSIIYYTVRCGALYLANALSLEEDNTTVFDMCWDETEYGFKLNPDLRNRLQGNNRILVYGAGRNARYLRKMMGEAQHQYVFFDQRAEFKECFIDGDPISPPFELSHFPGDPVVVTPYWGRDEIVEKLIQMGIEKSRIVLFCV